ncbi:MAG: 3-dehydroquinate synthase [Candidatus Deferrimicrobiaceae bacterium]
MNDEIITVSLGDRSYDIFFGTGVYPLFQEWVTRFFRGTPVFVVTDRTVHSIYGDDLGKWLSGVPHDVLSLPPGEERKRWDAVQEIYSFLARKGAGRDSLVVAFGGGVVGDLAGFAAATFLRGIPYVQIPTTLLSQVDSSVGGKTGFNLVEGKNLVGAFHQPRAVFIDPSFLLTLDERNMRAGMAEVVKCAFAGAPALLESIASCAKSWKKMSGDSWISIIRGAVAFKASVVESDEREASGRRILNLGHTIGHALEQASGYRQLLHGEAVAMGLAWEAVFSRRQGATSPGLERRLIDLLLEMGFVLDDPSIPVTAIAAAIGMDKKRMMSDIDMPLLTGSGSCALKRIPVSLLREELDSIREELRVIAGEREWGAGKEKAPPPEEKDLRESPAGLDEAAPPISELERRVVVNPRDVDAMVALAVAYGHAGNLSGAWDTIKEALAQDPSSVRAQRVARQIEREMKEALPEIGERTSPLLEEIVILEEGAFELRPADRLSGSDEERADAGDPRAEAPDTPPETSSEEAGTLIRTVTMASIYWDQGRQEESIRIIDEILRRHPNDARALAWREARLGKREVDREKRLVSALAAFLRKMKKEFGYDVPGHH